MKREVAGGFELNYYRIKSNKRIIDNYNNKPKKIFQIIEIK